MAEDKKFEADTNAAIQRENDEYDEYANNCIKEWKSSRKNIEPIVKVFGKEKHRNAPRTSNPGTEVDHFSRLGFTARHLPGQPTLPPIDG